MRQARTFAAESHREIVVTGIHVGMYGKDLDEGKDIVSLLDDLCLAIPEVRFRLSSIEPQEINRRLLNLMNTSENFMPHLHIPLQSGDDEILGRMNRRYTTKDFAKTLDLCRQYLPDAAIGIDVLVGFPGETESHFGKTVKFLTDLDCTYLHVFPYSKRPGTLASTYKNQIPRTIKEQRVAHLRALGRQKKMSFYKRSIGTVRPVLVEGKRDENGFLKGFTDNYIPVSFSGEDFLMNSVVQIKLGECRGTNVSGKCIQGAHER